MASQQRLTMMFVEKLILLSIYQYSQMLSVSLNPLQSLQCPPGTSDCPVSADAPDWTITGTRPNYTVHCPHFSKPCPLSCPLAWQFSASLVSLSPHITLTNLHCHCHQQKYYQLHPCLLFICHVFIKIYQTIYTQFSPLHHETWIITSHVESKEKHFFTGITLDPHKECEHCCNIFLWTQIMSD